MISYVNSFTSSGTTGNATINVSGLQAGDLMIAWLNVHAASGSPGSANPSGWSAVMADQASGVYLFRTAYRFWQAGESSYVWNMTNTDYWSVGVVAIRGADPNLPFGLVTNNFHAASGSTVATASQTATLSNQCLLLSLYASVAAAARTFLTPPGMTEAFDVNARTGLAADYQIISTPSDTGNRDATISGTAIVWLARQVIINPTRTHTWHYTWGDGNPALTATPGAPDYVYNRPHPFTLSDMNISALQAELSQPECHGQSLRFTWANREPSEGNRLWSDIDAALAALPPGKKLMLRVSAGAYAPQWVIDAGAATALYQAQNVCIPWAADGIYLGKWTNFLTAFGAKYNGHPLISAIQMSGGGKAGEMSLGADWPIAASGYTAALCISTWQTIIDGYHAAFPDTPCYLDIMEPITGISNGTVVPYVMAYGIAHYPNWFRAQNNGLNGTGAEPWGRDILQTASLGTSIGYQMTGSVNWNPGNVGDRQSAFQIALDDKATHVEIYHDDYADGSFASAIRYLAAVS
jgi:hypothetical protein